MYERVIAVTNRHLCQGDFLARIEAICRLGPRALILREKDLPEEDYRELAGRVMPLCERYGVAFFAHTFVRAARELGCENIHLPLPLLRETKPGTCSPERLAGFRRVSVSCHSVEDVLEAERLGAFQGDKSPVLFAVLGHIYDTDCKKGVPGRGLALLRAACGAASIPVYAIGGVRLDRLPELLEAGAAGGCMMSGLMREER